MNQAFATAFVQLILAMILNFGADAIANFLRKDK